MNKVVLGFGRFQPVTIGHEKLIESMKRIALQEGAQCFLFTTHTQDNKRNPLSYTDKLHFLEQAFGEDIVVESDATHFIAVLDEVREAFDDVTLVVGEDRLEDFTRILESYCGLNEGFTARAVSAGVRDPDAEGVEGASSSAVRQAVMEDDFERFCSMLPKTLTEDDVDDLYCLMAESLVLSEAVMDMQQRRKRAIQFRRLKPKMKIARERAKRRFASKDTLENRARKDAIKAVKTKLAGGKNYKTLPIAQKIAIDKRFQSRKKVVDMLTKRLLPKVRKQEVERHIVDKDSMNEALTKYSVEYNHDGKDKHFEFHAAHDDAARDVFNRRRQHPQMQGSINHTMLKNDGGYNKRVPLVKESLLDEAGQDTSVLKRYRIVNKKSGKVMASFDTPVEAIAYGKKNGGYDTCRMEDSDK